MKTVLLKKSILFLLIVICPTLVFSQKRLVDRANKKFEKFAFIDAREMYLKAAESGYESAELFKNLGDTYFFNRDFGNAWKWYEKLFSIFPAEAETDYYFRAALSLRSLKNYEQADTYMEKYIAAGGKGLVGRNFKKNRDYLKVITQASQQNQYTIEKVPINTSSSDFGPSFYGENKIVYASSPETTDKDKIYEWNNLPYLDLYVADMDDDYFLFNSKPIEGEINTDFHESSAVFTKDRSTVYFVRNNFLDGRERNDKTKTTRLKLYKARKSGENLWTDVVELPFSSDDYSVAHPTLSKDEKRLYFASDMPGSLGESDIWYVDVLGEGSYGNPVNLGADINTEANESFPFVSENNNLYFCSDGHPGLGGYDVFMVPIDAYGKLGGLTFLGEPINSNQDDFGFIINEQKNRGFLSSNRGGQLGSRDDDIYYFKKICNTTISGTVTDKKSKERIPNATIILYSEAGKEIERIQADSMGAFSFSKDNCESITYKVNANKENYNDNEQPATTSQENANTKIDLILDPIEKPVDVGTDLSVSLDLKPIYFDFNKAEIRPDAAIELNKVIDYLKEFPQITIDVRSHTDSRGKDQYNLRLSNQRNKSTIDYIVNIGGIGRARISGKGYGESELLNGCSNGVDCSEEEHEKNRRSEFIVIEN